MKYEKTGGKLEDAEIFKILLAGWKIISEDFVLYYLKNNKVYAIYSDKSEDFGNINSRNYNYYRVKEVEAEIELTEEMLNGWWKHKYNNVHRKFDDLIDMSGKLKIGDYICGSLEEFLDCWVPVEAKEVIEAMRRVGK